MYRRLHFLTIFLLVLVTTNYAEEICIDDFILYDNTNTLTLGEEVKDGIQFHVSTTETPQSSDLNEWETRQFYYDNRTIIYYFAGLKKITRITTSNCNLQTRRGVSVGQHLDELQKKYDSYLFIKRDHSWIIFFQWQEDAFITSEYYMEFKFSPDKIIYEIDLGIASQ